MRRVLLAKKMQSCDSYTINEVGIPSAVLMERASLACAKKVKEIASLLPGNEKKARILAICGSGNNGGDGVCCARILFTQGYNASVIMIGSPDHMTVETRRQVDIAEKLGLSVSCTVPETLDADIMIDAIFGIGLSRTVSGSYADTIARMNESGAKILAVDIPSGVNADTGEIMGTCVRACATVTMQCLKPGLLLNPGAQFAGEVIPAEIGVVPLEEEHLIYALEDGDIRKLLPKRTRSGNKGTFGKILIVAGSKDMGGAAYLAASAALRTGCGMVKVITHAANRTMLLTLMPEVMLDCYTYEEEAASLIAKNYDWADVIAAGPGIGTGESSREMINMLLKTWDGPLVLDADGINVLDGDTSLLKAFGHPLFITPHVGEMSRLIGKPVQEIKKDLIVTAGRVSSDLGLSCILKDARSVTASHGLTFINVSGNSGMATAGSGDTLTGILASLIAQHTDLRFAGALAAYIHGRAGDMAADKSGEYSMTAGDITAMLPLILNA